MMQPAPDEPGTFGQQMEILTRFWSLDSEVRNIDRETVWQACRQWVLTTER